MVKLDTIYTGKALDILQSLPDNSIDLCVTSPPYNKEKNTSTGNLAGKVIYSGFRDSMPEEDYQNWQVDTLNELWRIIKPGGSLFYNHKIRWHRGMMYHPYSWLQRTKWTIRQEIIWDKMIAANLRGWRFWQVEEHIYWLYKPIGGHLVGKELRSKHALLTSIWRIPPSRGTLHPASFPIQLPTRIIYAILDEEKGGIVIDPFAGIGTTLVAAKLLGHHYIGIDISPDYVRIAKERLENAEAEWPAVEEEKKRHVVKKTYKQRKADGDYLGPYAKRRKNKRHKK